MQQFFHRGNYEPVKAGVHGTLLGLSALCLGYNAIAWLLRREKHLARNAVIYGALTALELAQLRSHIGRTTRDSD